MAGGAGEPLRGNTKPHQPGKWRLIVDLSHPKGFSINDGIEAELCSLKYTSVEEAVK